jgi:beta-N-acetylhexosaminidase
VAQGVDLRGGASAHAVGRPSVRAVVIAALLLTACTGPDDATTDAAASAAPSPTSPAFVVPVPPSPAPVSERCPVPPPSPSVVDPATLSPSEQAGLLVVAGIPHVVDIDDPEATAVLAAGVGGLVLKAENLIDPAQARTLAEDLAAAAPLGLLLFVDQEGGRVAHARAVVEDTPSARRLGRALAEDPSDPAARDAGETIGAGLRTLGIHATLAPVADLDDGPYDTIIGDRSFGGTAAVATPAVVAFTQGLRARGTLAVAKHFPGYAGADDTHATTAAVELDRDELADDLGVFEELIEAGVDAVMVGHVSYEAFGGVPASVDPEVYEHLRATGFDGVAVTDSLGMGAVHRDHGHGGAAVAALRAGADLVLANQGSEAAREMRDAIMDAVATGELSSDRIDEALRRVMLLRARQAEVAASCR